MSSFFYAKKQIRKVAMRCVVKTKFAYRNWKAVSIYYIEQRGIFLVIIESKEKLMKKLIRKISVFIIMCLLLTAVLAGCVDVTSLGEGARFTIDENGNVLENESADGEFGGGVNFVDEKNADENEVDETVDETVEVPKVTYIRAKVGSLNVRSGQGAQFSSLGILDKGDMLWLIQENSGWYTTYFRNQTAYVSSIYTELVDLKPTDNEVIENIVIVGVKLLGTPYVYGATRLHNGKGTLLSGFSVNKFDCSSLMQFMFFYGASVNLQLTTRTQIKQGSYVSKSDLVRGDLMFFTNASRYYNTGVERVGHVALFLGDNYILHTASDHAVIEQISATRWKYFIEGRRMV